MGAADVEVDAERVHPPERERGGRRGSTRRCGMCLRAAWIRSRSAILFSPAAVDDDGGVRSFRRLKSVCTGSAPIAAARSSTRSSSLATVTDCTPNGRGECGVQTDARRTGDDDEHVCAGPAARWSAAGVPSATLSGNAGERDRIRAVGDRLQHRGASWDAHDIGEHPSVFDPRHRLHAVVGEHRVPLRKLAV